jgi:hypothetical protein
MLYHKGLNVNKNKLISAILYTSIAIICAFWGLIVRQQDFRGINSISFFQLFFLIYATIGFFAVKVLWGIYEEVFLHFSKKKNIPSNIKAPIAYVSVILAIFCLIFLSIFSHYSYQMEEMTIAQIENKMEIRDRMDSLLTPLKWLLLGITLLGAFSVTCYQIFIQYKDGIRFRDAVIPTVVSMLAFMFFLDWVILIFSKIP